jgi:hypothetical protein
MGRHREIDSAEVGNSRPSTRGSRLAFALALTALLLGTFVSFGTRPRQAMSSKFDAFHQWGARNPFDSSLPSPTLLLDPTSRTLLSLAPGSWTLQPLQACKV